MRGSSIEPHFDDFWLWGERLVTLNLQSDSVLCFTNENQPGIEIHVPMFRRSLLIVYGPARHLWKHAIHRSDILNKRLAITMAQKYIDNTEKRYNLTTQHPLNTGGELKMLH
jgi:alkylated DNA repair protein alkB family protein 4